jgi:protein disulfide-isomerase
VTTLFPNGASEQRSKLIERWLQAAEWLETNPKAGISTRLHAVVPQYELWRVENPEKPLPSELVAKVKAAVASAEKEAKSSYERHAVISDGAEMLADVGDVEGARAMLVNELKTTDTPWYYQSTLAGIELKAGRQTEALEWSREASESSTGNATHLQWLLIELRALIHVKEPSWDGRLATVLRLYLTSAFKLPDGFAGRNLKRAIPVIAELTQALPRDRQTEAASIWASFSGQCEAQVEPLRQAEFKRRWEQRPMTRSKTGHEIALCGQAVEAMQQNVWKAYSGIVSDVPCTQLFHHPNGGNGALHP